MNNNDEARIAYDEENPPSRSYGVAGEIRVKETLPRGVPRALLHSGFQTRESVSRSKSKNRSISARLRALAEFGRHLVLARTHLRGAYARCAGTALCLGHAPETIPARDRSPVLQTT